MQKTILQALKLKRKYIAELCAYGESVIK